MVASSIVGNGDVAPSGQEEDEDDDDDGDVDVDVDDDGSFTLKHYLSWRNMNLQPHSCISFSVYQELSLT